MNTILRILPLVTLYFLLLGELAHADEIAVIVNRDNVQQLDKAIITRIFLGKTSKWDDGSHIDAFDQPEDSPLHDEFYSSVLGKSPSLVKTIWAQNIFTGKKLPPRIINPDEAIKQAIRNNKNAIGYIRASSLDSSVKAVTIK